MDLDLRLVRYAVVLADELHFARAATRLHIAQQTLSAQISQLEARLGVNLFLRDRRGVELTPAGELFIARGRDLLSDAQDLLAELRETKPPLRLDVITEGLTAGVVARELGSRIDDLLVEIRQSQGLAVTASAVAEGRIDLAFGWVDGLETALPPSLHSQLVRLEPIGVVLPAGHRLAAFEEVPMHELAQHPMVVHTAEEAVDWQTWIETVVEAFDLDIGWRLHGHGRSAANAAVVTYQAPAFASMEAPVPDGVVVRPVIAPVPLCPVEVVWRARGTTPARLRRALSAIRDITNEHGWILPPTTEHWLPAPRVAARTPRKGSARPFRNPA
ncbi:MULTISPECIES: LysR family transcriptional regulator [Mycolicibacterium]|uniref:Probable hydrogen peroxide-inducible genes activator n=1 Tax=Mycolicibacterium senegalense TaxID=1796 RepID=A0A378W682_9MYCO|nr:MULTISPECIES: LysR family transcriptional regulator [Mycolicibacterium]MCV7336076.1 LysR family transcriptional regulator [Mycolicibacterium senegalense]MDR7287918.1 DNA-binding transcriptional LysR family regulator [Mycolicibacterium senegalense]QZA24921.1 LysR family transcriptional regulator [Mycolicibacterium senegalense]CDP86674.1 LysR family transcriptional regulator [Mycolicibacterium farcinogenes]SUA28506.1 transcriptional regulator [Mycolicibacterium senegalense]